MPSIPIDALPRRDRRRVPRRAQHLTSLVAATALAAAVLLYPDALQIFLSHF